MSKVEEYELKQVEIPIERFLSHTLTQYDSEVLMKELKINDKSIADVISYTMSKDENKKLEIQQEHDEEYKSLLVDLQLLSPYNTYEQQPNTIHNRQ
jgi:hypothetical protein